jgi:pre-mRNA-splicing factor SYF1
MYQYINLLLSIENYDEAAKQLLKAIQSNTESGKSASFEMFDKLCSLAVQHPESLVSVSAEIILRAGIRHFPQQCAKFWNSLARYWIHQGRIERARNAFEEGIRTISNMKDFTQVFDAYVEFEERVVTAQMKAVAKRQKKKKKEGVDQVSDELAKVDINFRLERLERLMENRPILVNEVLLRQNPHNVQEWLKKIVLHKKKGLPMKNLFEEAIETIHPKQASGKLDEIWSAYASYHEESGNVEEARRIYERGVQVDFKTVNELVALWVEYADMELRHGNVEKAIELIGRATAIPANMNIDFRDQVYVPLWSLLQFHHDRLTSLMFCRNLRRNVDYSSRLRYGRIILIWKSVLVQKIL